MGNNLIILMTFKCSNLMIDDCKKLIYINLMKKLTGVIDAECWTVKKAECRKIDAFELWCWRRLLSVPWTARRSNRSILKEVSPGRTDAEAETPIRWPPNEKSWLIGKYPDAGRDWGQEEKGMTEDDMVGWHHGLNWHEFE